MKTSRMCLSTEIMAPWSIRKSQGLQDTTISFFEFRAKSIKKQHAEMSVWVYPQIIKHGNKHGCVFSPWKPITARMLNCHVWAHPSVFEEVQLRKSKLISPNRPSFGQHIWTEWYQLGYSAMKTRVCILQLSPHLLIVKTTVKWWLKPP